MQIGWRTGAFVGPLASSVSPVSCVMQAISRIEMQLRRITPATCKCTAFEALAPAVSEPPEEGRLTLVASFVYILELHSTEGAHFGR